MFQSTILELLCVSMKTVKWTTSSVHPVDHLQKSLATLIHVLFGHIRLGVYVLKHVVLVNNHEVSLVTWDIELLTTVNVHSTKKNLLQNHAHHLVLNGLLTVGQVVRSLVVVVNELDYTAVSLMAQNYLILIVTPR